MVVESSSEGSGDEEIRESRLLGNGPEGEERHRPLCSRQRLKASALALFVAAASIGALIVSRNATASSSFGRAGSKASTPAPLREAGAIARLPGDEVCFEAGVDFADYDLSERHEALTTDGAPACKEMCASDAVCRHFTWESDTTRCRLKSSSAGRRSWANRISGPAHCMSPSEAGSEAKSLANAGMCNDSMPVPNHVTARAFTLKPEVLEWCQSDDAKPGGAWNAPGRNWCWLNMKARACYNQEEGDGLPNWWWAQEAAAKAGVAPKPEEALFEGLENPTLCDMPQNGASLTDVPAAELAVAVTWVAANVAMYVLNLPGSTVRWNKMRTRLRSLGFEPERIDGVNLGQIGGIPGAQAAGLIPKDWDYTKAMHGVRTMLSTSDDDAQYIVDDMMGIGTVGCAAAHLNAQRVGAQLSKQAGKQLFIIMEDDVEVESDFAPRLHRILRDEAPCDWDAISLTSRCSYGICVAPHLSRVQPDGNEPETRCHNGVNFGMYGTLYRASQIRHIQNQLLPVMWNSSHPGCLPIDVAMAAVSDRMSYYAVPHTQRPGLMHEATASWAASDRRNINRAKS